MKLLSLLLGVALVAASAAAESTRFWDQTTYQSLTKGSLHGLSVQSDGTLRLGPRFDLIKETDSAYLWSAIQDAQGNIYAGGGSPARVYRIPPGGEPTVFFESQDLEIHALAVDRNGMIYAATSPDGAIHRINPNGNASVFYDPKVKYIWALAFDSRDNLYIATGDKGQIVRVSPSGEGKVFFDSDETHIRSMIIDGRDNVYAGTDGNGMIMRIAQDGSAFVLYESPKKEVTSLVLDDEGALYVASVGDKPGSSGPAPPPPSSQPIQVTPGAPPAPPRPSPSVLTMNLAGGSEVYRILPNATTQRLWSSRSDIVYALALDSQGKLLIGTGNEGRIYEIEPGGLTVNLVESISSQITALLNVGKEILVAASNVGRLYSLKPQFIAEGSFVSDVFDAGRAAQWGRLQWRQQLPPGTTVRFETRSGNSSNTSLNWSPWKAATVNGTEAASQSPPRPLLPVESRARIHEGRRNASAIFRARRVLAEQCRASH